MLAFPTRRRLAAIVKEYSDALSGERAVRTVLVEDDWRRAGQVQIAACARGDRPLRGRVGAARGSGEVRQRGRGSAVRSGRRRMEAGGGLRFRRARRGARDVLPRAKGWSAGWPRRAGRRLWCTMGLRTLLQVRSGLAEWTPTHLAFLPAEVDEVVVAVVELGFLGPVSDRVVHPSRAGGRAHRERASLCAIQAAPQRTPLRIAAARRRPFGATGGSFASSTRN